MTLENWKLKDLLLVTVIVLLFSSLMIPIGDIVFHSEKVGKYLFLAMACLLSSIIPVMWIRKFYDFGRNRLGIQRGGWSIKFTTLVGVNTALIYFLLSLFFLGSIAGINRLSLSSFIKSLPLLSADGFLIIVLYPISEEIYIRGFIYGYLKPKLGVKFGLFLQALLFGFLHFTPTFPVPTFSPVIVAQGFFVGLLCGVLYQISGSLYPSMIYHGTFSYLTLTFRIGQLNL